MPDFTDHTNDASDLLDASIEAIDAKFGDGYAKAHPELLGAFMISTTNIIQCKRFIPAR